MTAYCKFIESGTSIPATGSAALFHVGASNGSDARLACWSNNVGGYTVIHDNGPTSNQVSNFNAPALGDLVELRAVLLANGGVVLAVTVNRGAENVVSVLGDNAPLATEWSGPLVQINSVGTAQVGFNRFLALKIHRGIRSMAFMRAL